MISNHFLKKILLAVAILRTRTAHPRGGATPPLRLSTACSSSVATKVSAIAIIHHRIGQYLGDIWMYDFRQLKYTNVIIESDQGEEYAKNMLSRSNHTAVFYRPHNR